MEHTFLNRWPWKGLLRQCCFMKKLQTDHVDLLRKNISGRGTASAKAKSGEHAWCTQGMMWKPVWLQQVPSGCGRENEPREGHMGADFTDCLLGCNSDSGFLFGP